MFVYISHQISVVYSKNAYFIIDSEWPDNYISFVINSVKPDFIIYEITNEDNKVDLFIKIIFLKLYVSIWRYLKMKIIAMN